MSRNWVGAARNQPTIQTQAHDQNESGQDAPGALGVEHRERKTAGSAFRQDDTGNKKARNDEEHVDPGKAAGNERAVGVEGDDAEHRKRAETVDVLPEAKVASGARRRDIGSVEGLVQERVLPPSRQDAPEGVEYALGGVKPRAPIGKRRLVPRPASAHNAVVDNRAVDDG